MVDKTIMEVLINTLVGTCKSLDEACDLCNIEFDDLDFELLDSEIFLCDTCNWWCSIDEQVDTGACIECNPKEEEED